MHLEFIRHYCLDFNDSPQAQLVCDEIQRVLTTELEMEGCVQTESVVLWKVADRMSEQGGDFVKGIASLYFRADGINQRKILSAFANYFLEYSSDQE